MKPLVTKNKYELISDSFEGDLPETPTEAARPLLSKAVVYVAGGSRHPYEVHIKLSLDRQTMIGECITLLVNTQVVSYSRDQERHGKWGKLNASVDKVCCTIPYMVSYIKIQVHSDFSNPSVTVVQWSDHPLDVCLQKCWVRVLVGQLSQGKRC